MADAISHVYADHVYLSVAFGRVFSRCLLLEKKDGSRRNDARRSSYIFNTIDFEKVYHDAPIAGLSERQEIHDIRMSEVLVPGEIDFNEHVSYTMLQSQLDADSLAFMVGRRMNY